MTLRAIFALGLAEQSYLEPQKLQKLHGPLKQNKDKKIKRKAFF